MKLYGGIDLHSNNRVVALSDEEDHVGYPKRLANEPVGILEPLKPYRDAMRAWWWNPPAGSPRALGCGAHPLAYREQEPEGHPGCGLIRMPTEAWAGLQASRSPPACGRWFWSQICERRVLQRGAKERTLGFVALAGVGREGVIQGMGSEERVGLAQPIGTVAGPAAIGWLRYHAGAHRIKLDVALVQQ